MNKYFDELTIGQMAELNMISTQTLRYYDQIGLLKPDYLDENTGYRYYKINQSAVLDMITHMKSLNMSLDQIRDCLNTNNRENFINELKSEQLRIQSEIKRLKNIQNIINQKISDHDRYLKLPKIGIPYIESIPKRTIFKYDTKINYYYNKENTSTVYEYMLRLFKNNISKKNLPIIYFYNVGSIMSKENLLKRDFFATELFVFCDGWDKNDESYEIIDANTFMCIVCEDTNLEIDYIYLLLETIDKSGCHIIGDYICEVIYEFFSAKDLKRDMILKLQIPIAFK